MSMKVLSKKPRSTLQPQLEALEDRCCPSTVTATLSGTVLTVKEMVANPSTRVLISELAGVVVVSTLPGTRP
jgi:hypothetical protein